MKKLSIINKAQERSREEDQNRIMNKSVGLYDDDTSQDQGEDESNNLRKVDVHQRKNMT